MADPQSLHLACYEGRLRVVEAMLEQQGVTAAAKDSDNRTPLHWAALGGHIELVRLLLQRPEVDSQVVNAADEEGWSPLLSATAAGTVKLLQQYWTPLHFTAGLLIVLHSPALPFYASLGLLCWL